MRSALIVLIFGLLIGGCETAEDLYGSGPLDLYGSGPLTVLPEVRAIIEGYTDEKQTGSVAVREDGRYAYVVNCNSSECARGAVEACESNGGKCWIYGFNGIKVWNGPVSNGWGWKMNEVGRYHEQVICYFSIDHSVKPLKWNTVHPSAARFLEVAKRRNLTLEYCLKYEANGGGSRERKVPGANEVKKSRAKVFANFPDSPYFEKDIRARIDAAKLEAEKEGLYTPPAK